MNTIKVDMDVCSGCKTCYEACFVNVFRWNGEEDKPVVAYPEDCVECNKCELSCPVGAIEVIPGFIGEQAPVRVDHQMATTLPGLFAIGDTSWAGSAWQGAVPPPGRMRGTGLGNAVFSGVRAGLAALKYVSGAGPAEVNTAQAEALKESMFAPLKRSSGIQAPELVRLIQDVMSPVGNSIYMRQDRMEGALSKVLEIKAKLPELCAKDWHYLSACNEVRSMATSAEMFFRASIERKESRGWHIREDYPEVDNENWLKWIIIQNKKGEMVISTEDIPIERYPIKP